jgi:hypothetical protein
MIDTDAPLFHLTIRADLTPFTTSSRKPSFAVRKRKPSLADSAKPSG